MKLDELTAATPEELEGASWTIVSPSALDKEIAALEALAGPMPTEQPTPDEGEWERFITVDLKGVALENPVADLGAVLAKRSPEFRAAVRLCLAQVRTAIEEGRRLRSSELGRGQCLVRTLPGERFAQLLCGELAFAWTVRLDAMRFPPKDPEDTGSEPA